jgi:hypothetical protein
MMTSKDGPAHTEIDQHNTISMAMEDLPEAESVALKKELQEEMATARSRKLVCFQKTCITVIKKTAPTVTTTATMATTSTVTPNITPKELVKFMDVAVASKYGNDLSNFTRVITDDMHSTLENFKTDLQNTLPRQIRSVVQHVQGEAQGKQPDLAHSTPYTVASGNMGVLANTSTPHPGNTSGNVIYVDANSPYPGSPSMGNLGGFPITSIPYPGDASTSVNTSLPAYTTQPNPSVSPNFQQPYYQTMSYEPKMPPMGMGIPHRPIPDIHFLRTPAYATPNPQVEGDNEGVRDQIVRTLREFEFTPKGRTRSYQKPYSEYFDTIPYPRGFRVPDLAKFTGDDAKTMYEHIGQFLAQVNDMGITDVDKIRMFLLSLTVVAFNWFTSLPLNSIDSWVS